MSLNLLAAKEARDLQQSRIDERGQAIFDEVCKIIEQAVTTTTDFHVRVYLRLPERVKNVLLAKGYKVTVTTEPNGDGVVTEISW